MAEKSERRISSINNIIVFVIKFCLKTEVMKIVLKFVCRSIPVLLNYTPKFVTRTIFLCIYLQRKKNGSRNYFYRNINVKRHV